MEISSSGSEALCMQVARGVSEDLEGQRGGPIYGHQNLHRVPEKEGHEDSRESGLLPGILHCSGRHHSQDEPLPLWLPGLQLQQVRRQHA